MQSNIIKKDFKKKSKDVLDFSIDSLQPELIITLELNIHSNFRLEDTFYLAHSISFYDKELNKTQPLDNFCKVVNQDKVVYYLTAKEKDNIKKILEK